MKATELRIGILIFDIEKNIEIEVNDINFSSIIEGCDYLYPVDEKFKGILLTEKWFLRFKFTKTAVKTYNKDFKPWTYQIEKHPSFKDGYIFFIDIHGVSAPPSVKIKYVHQLQNLYLALTGEELCPKP